MLSRRYGHVSSDTLWGGRTGESSRREGLVIDWRVYISWPPFYWVSNEIGTITCQRSGPQDQMYRRVQIAVANFVEEKLAL